MTDNRSNATPLVSVLIRTRNRPHFLIDALQSVNRQNYKNIEVVLINDGGQSVTHLIKQHLRADIARQYMENQPAKGRAGALNSGIAAARGEWIAFLDDDDIYLPDHLTKLVHTAATHKNSGVIYSYSKVTNNTPNPDEDKDSFIIGRTVNGGEEPFAISRLIIENYIPLLNLLVHKQVFTCAGQFDQQLEVYEDWDFLLRAARVTRFTSIDMITAIYRRHTDSITVIETGRELVNREKIYQRYPDIITENFGQIALHYLQQRDISISLYRDMEQLKIKLQQAEDRNRPLWLRLLKKVKRRIPTLQRPL